MVDLNNTVDYRKFPGYGNATKGILGEGDKLGKYQLGLDAVNTGVNIYGAYNGREQVKAAKDALNFSKGQFQNNFAAQQQLTNTQLLDKEYYRARSSGYSEQEASLMANQYVQQFGIQDYVPGQKVNSVMANYQQGINRAAPTPPTPVVPDPNALPVGAQMQTQLPNYQLPPKQQLPQNI